MQMIVFYNSSGVQKVVGEGDPLPVSGSFSSTPVTADTAVTNAVVTIASSDTSVLAANASRKGAFVTNLSDQTIWVKFGATAVQSACIPVVAGGSLPISVDGVVWEGSVRAICQSGSKSLFVVEV